MEIKKKVETAFNKQINAEMYSAYLYLSMSAYLETKSLGGFAHWMRQQFKEETSHALKLFNHIIERGGNVVLTKIGEPTKEWKSITDVFEHVYNHEKHVTSLINNLVDVARAEKDYQAEMILHWFVNEQTEEEESASKILEQLNKDKDKENLIHNHVYTAIKEMREK